jgi:hypothetical protein
MPSWLAAFEEDRTAGESTRVGLQALQTKDKFYDSMTWTMTDIDLMNAFHDCHNVRSALPSRTLMQNYKHTQLGQE